MKRNALLFTALAVMLSTGSALAQQTNTAASAPKVTAKAKGRTPAATVRKPESSTDLAAIRAASRKFVVAFNKGDAKAVALLWTNDGDYIDETGQRFVGRKAIELEYANFFTENPGVKIRVISDSVRLLNDTSALEDGHSILDPPPAGAPVIGKYMAVHVKVDGKWLMSTVRDSRVEIPSTYRNVADLEWLIGTWTAEEQGVKMKSVCRWIANKSFIQRNYKVTRTDSTTTSGTQLIGWNPENGHVQSWNFSSDGGHAVGIWSPIEGGWAAEMHGVTGNGMLTTAVNRLKRLDENAYVWQSVERTAGGSPLPDLDEVVIKRQLKSGRQDEKP